MNRRSLFLLTGVGGLFLFLFAGLAHAQVIPERPAAEFPGIGNRTAIWVVAQLHVLFAAFILGAPIFVSVCEILGVKWNAPQYDKLARDILKISMMLYSMAALTGGALLLAMIALYPDLSSWYMSHMFELMAIAYPILFIGETVILYIYYYTWDYLQNEKKGRHVALGLLLNTFGILVLMLGNALTSFMNTPIKSTVEEMDLRTYLETTATLWEKINNYSWMTMNFHRLIGNSVYGGFVVGLIGAYKYLWARTEEEKAHYDWVGFVGNFFGVGSLMFFPLIGYIHASSFYMYDASLGPYMMADQLSMYWEVQGAMIGLIFFASAYYMWESMKRIEIRELPPHEATPLKPVMAAVLSTILPGLGHVYSGKVRTGLLWLVWVYSLIIVVHQYLKSLEPLTGTTHFLVLLWGFPIFFYLMNIRRAHRATEKVPPGRSGVLLAPIRWLASGLVHLDRFALGERRGVMKFSFLVIVIGNAVWLTPHAFVGAVSQLTDENYARLALPDQWDFLALMPAKNTAAALMVLMILIAYILYIRAVAVGTIRWGKIGFVPQLALIILAFSATYTMGVMGVVRSAIRKYWHIYLALPDLTEENFTVQLSQASLVIAIVTVVFYVAVTASIWLALQASEPKKTTG